MGFLDEVKDITVVDILYFPVKVLGFFMVWQALPRREKARAKVQAYVLGRNKTGWLKRLWERQPLWDGSEGWWLDPSAVGHSAAGPGYVAYMEVSTLDFYWTVLTTWGWLDDDANEDTTDWRHVERTHPKCLEGVEKPKFGNSFDLGMIRGQYPFCKKCAVFWWTCMRNLAMNFQYLWRNY